MKIFKTVPRSFTTIENPTQTTKIVGLSGRIVCGDIGDATTPHTYCVVFHREVTEGEETRVEAFKETSLKVTQAETLALVDPATQYAAIAALASQYDYQLLPQNQQ